MGGTDFLRYASAPADIPAERAAQQPVSNLRRHLEGGGADGVRLADALAEEGGLPRRRRGRLLDICE